ncbi:MAG: hypothetical protein GY696_12620 [Gammaproteobacteria bacterium]|nr:hypothetical protein [Gammaproteobacteria bacterium]
MTTSEVVLEHIRGYDWYSFVPTLMPMTDSFCFKALVDDSATTSDRTDRQLCFCQIEIAPILNLGGEEMGVGGSEQDDFFSDDDFLFNGRCLDQRRSTMDGQWIQVGWANSAISMDFIWDQSKKTGFNGIFAIINCGLVRVFGFVFMYVSW